MSREALKRAFIAGWFANNKERARNGIGPIEVDEYAFDEWYEGQRSFVTGEHHAPIPNGRAHELIQRSMDAGFDATNPAFELDKKRRRRRRSDPK